MLTALIGKYGVSTTQGRSLVEKIENEKSDLKNWADTPKFKGKLLLAPNKVKELVDSDKFLMLALTLGDTASLDLQSSQLVALMDQVNEALDEVDDVRTKIRRIAEDTDSD